MNRYLLTMILVIGIAAVGQATIHNISIVALDFSPADITIFQGDTVRWTNLDGVVHTSTSDALIWDSGLMVTNQSYQRQFNTLGTFPYHCATHPSMLDTLKVELKTDVRSGGDSPLPKKFNLLQNYPNPFNASTLISYELPQTGEVILTIYNVLGQQVRIYQPGRQSAGSYSIIWDGRNQEGSSVGSGIYFYRLKAGDNFNQIRKMTFIK